MWNFRSIQDARPDRAFIAACYRLRSDRINVAMSLIGTFETCRRALRMSAYRGRSEVTGRRSKLLTLSRHSRLGLLLRNHTIEPKFAHDAAIYANEISRNKTTVDVGTRDLEANDFSNGASAPNKQSCHREHD